MCIVVFAWKVHPLYPFLLLLNRDEYHHRPTKSIGWWEGGEILGGRDEVAGGTWLACTRDGRVSFLTNVLELHTLPEAKSRGDLPLRFLESKKSSEEFAKEIVKEVHEYNGFNLITLDLSSNKMFYISNRPKGEPPTVQQVQPGIHVLSNAKLNVPWPKVQRLKLNFKRLLSTYDDDEDIPIKDMIDKLMRDDTKADKSQLPNICSIDWEYNLSSIFVEVDTPLGRYGTRSMIALSIRDTEEASLHETYVEKELWWEKTINYYINSKVKINDITLV
ncbi:putative transport and Golgi organization protein [Helianthus annuus]|uniref:Transport and Golgi organization protein n=1 Tax=Helianthus annuus TaxID=4232 RepID=A0A251UQ45_HELAN|nr:transport and Golgi organization 2 homolog [Helianthus annuus]KAF5805773.1 putative transport and Golgi organization protein [Helianthus annuus]KAJ0584480.1 putative transport and Golgi organization protein [Helianthus annuus]KAJ0750154.1 putative transport and Golgi organization protein [Helianthus annuus]KAJ0918853.1 putative transport and Golgi organization protein [Helianthus annuus]KAJ0922648.1 putative transport and Golgi organization protein [Helianthus annuus]